MNEFGGVDASGHKATMESAKQNALYGGKNVPAATQNVVRADEQEKSAAEERPSDVVDVEKVLGVGKANPESEVYGLVKEMNRSLNNVTSLRFSVDRESRSYVVSIVDEDTDEVVRQINSNNMADVTKRMRDLEGLLYDQKA